MYYENIVLLNGTVQTKYKLTAGDKLAVLLLVLVQTSPDSTLLPRHTTVASGSTLLVRKCCILATVVCAVSRSHVLHAAAPVETLLCIISLKVRTDLCNLLKIVVLSRVIQPFLKF